MRLLIVLILTILPLSISADDVLSSKSRATDTPIETATPISTNTPVVVTTVITTLEPTVNEAAPASPDATSTPRIVSVVPDKLTLTETKSGEITLIWNKKGTEQSYYNVYRSTGAEFQKINVEQLEKTAYVDKSITAKTIYDYKIETISSNGNKSMSKQERITTARKPLAPVQIMFDGSKMKNVKLSWVKASDDALYYNVYRKIQREEYLKLNVEKQEKLEFLDETIIEGTSYKYKVEAFDKDGNKEESADFNYLSAKTVMPGIPGGFKTYQDTESALLKWNNPLKGTYDVSGYNVYRGKTPEKIEFYKFIKAEKKSFEDTDVEAAIKYYYYMKTTDIEKNESVATETLTVVPYPAPRTGLVMMPSAFRNNVYDNFGLNVDMAFSYFIGSIYGEHDIDTYGKGVDTINKVGVSILTADVKGTVFNEYENYPSLAIGYLFSLVLLDQIGSSDTSGTSTSFGTKDNSLITLHGFYAATSKKILFETTLHGGYIFGFGDPNKGKTKNEQVEEKEWWQMPGPMGFTPHLSKYIEPDDYGDSAYFFGISRPLFDRMGIKIEYIVPHQANDNALMPDYYMINTHVDRLINFDIGYFHFPGGYAWMGYINFRFTVFPNPYK